MPRLHSAVLFVALMTAALAACQPTTPPPASEVDKAADAVTQAEPPATSDATGEAPDSLAAPHNGTGNSTPVLSHWQCGEMRVDVRVDPGAGNATLAFSGRKLLLMQTETASGASYADGNGNEFHTQGAAARLTLSDRPQIECTQADSPSPWTEAIERRIGFRAVGNEPGWLVEVGMGPTPAITAQLDYGERTLEVAAGAPDSSGYFGTTADGTKVKLSILRHPCEDGMSGEAFEAGAELHVDGKTYRGCGAFLFD